MADPFAAFPDPEDAAAQAAPKPNGADPFAAFPEPGETTTALGAAATEAAFQAAPTIGSMPAIGAGSAAGFAVGGPVGALIGGAGAGIAAGYGLSKAQDYIVQKLPGGDEAERGRLIGETEHPYASFSGGFFPAMLLSRPGALEGLSRLPENASNLDRVILNPITHRLLLGAGFGGIQLGQDIAQGLPPDLLWPRAAIATGFGIIFNKPTRFGELALGGFRGFGAQAPKEGATAGAMPQTPEVETPSAAWLQQHGITEKEWLETLVGQKQSPGPTLAEAADAKIAGTGITESVTKGTEQQAPEAAQAAQQNVRDEQTALGTTPTETADVHSLARQQNFELFNRYDHLSAMRDTLEAAGDKKHLATVNDELLAIEPEIATAYRRSAEEAGTSTVVPAVPETYTPNEFISSDVKRQLMEAGRSEEYATAVGKLQAAHYVALAHHFNGEIGRPEDLYRQHGAEIYGPEGKPKKAAPVDLLGYVRSLGGIQDAGGELRAAGAKKGVGRNASIIAKEGKGVSWKDLHDLLTEDGWLPATREGENPDERDAMDLVLRAVHGEKIYPAQDQQRALELQSEAEHLSRQDEENHLADLMEQIIKEAHPGFELRPDERSVAADLYAKGERDPDNAIERLASANEYYQTKQEPLPDDFRERLAETVKTSEPAVKAPDGSVWRVKKEGDGNYIAMKLRGDGNPPRYYRAPKGEKWTAAQAIDRVVNELTIPVHDEAIAKAAAALNEENGQKVIPGAGKVSTKELLERRAKAPLKGNVAQNLLMDTGLFGDKGQGELFQSAYHGTPHEFDKFTTDHIGSGEGAQAYGWGLYFAGKKAVGKFYREKLAYRKMVHDFQLALEDHASIDEVEERIGSGDFTPAQDRVLRALKADDWLGYDYPSQAISAAFRQSWEATHYMSAETHLAIAALGRLYHVEIPENEQLLDWDKPLSEQPSTVKKALTKLGIKSGKIKPIWENPTGDHVYNLVSSKAETGDLYAKVEERGDGSYDITLYGRGGRSTPMGTAPTLEAAKQLAEENTSAARLKYDPKGSDLYDDLITASNSSGNYFKVDRSAQEKASKALLRLGVKGIRYLDQGSRYKSQGSEASHNFVIFDGADVAIKEYEQNKGGDSGAPQGKITLRKGMAPIVTLFAHADESTAVHELMHGWIEEMRQYVQHPAAPPQFKADWQAMLDWSGNKGEPLTKTQHEKLARGFEQYLREGVAPSPELASVFEKFRQWLVQIYRTARDIMYRDGRHLPISPAMRGVYKRLLVAEGRPVTIAPELGRGKMLADIHAAEAQHEPSEATADRISAERERAANEPPFNPENVNKAIADYEAEHGAPEASEGSEGRGNVGEGGAASGAGATRSGVGAEPTAERPGGSGGEAEQPTEPTTGRPGASGGPGNTAALAPRPADKFGEPVSNLVGKAGNVRPENITSAKDLVDAIELSSQRLEADGKVQGVMTKGQMLDLADDFAIDPAKIDEEQLGRLFGGLKNLGPKIWALRQTVKTSAAIVANLAKQYVKSNDVRDLAAAMEAIQRHDMIQSVLSGVTTEVGRGLGMAFKNMEGWQKAENLAEFLQQATGKTLFQIKSLTKLISAYETPEQISSIVRDFNKRSFGRMILEYWINGLISGPATHITYMLGNTILAVMKMGPETFAAAMVGKARTAMGREGETMRAGEVPAQFKGAVKGLAPALKAAGQGFKSGVTTLLPGEDFNNLPRQPGQVAVQGGVYEPNVRYRDLAHETFGLIRGLRDGFIAAGKLVAAGGIAGEPLLGTRYSPLGAIPDITVRGMNVLPVGTAVRLPGRFISAIHSFFRSVNYSASIAGQAYRAAEGDTGRMAELYMRPTPEMLTLAHKESTKLTLMSKGSPFVQALSRLTNTELGGFPLFKFIDPFVTIAGNVIDQSLVQRTPVGLLSPALRADLMGHNGTIAQDMAQARMLVGTGLIVAFGSLAAQGLISGSGPSDPRRASVWRNAGNQPHSVRIGDTWIAMSRLGPLGMLASLSSDFYDVAHAGAQGDLEAAAHNLVIGAMRTILDENFLKGPSDLIMALEDPDRYGQAYIRNFLSTFVPFSVGVQQMDRATDPYLRQARSILDTMISKIPLMSESLYPKRGVWGLPLQNSPALGGRAISALYETPVSNDPVNLAMDKLGMAVGPPDRKIAGVQLTDGEYDTYSLYAGQIAKHTLDRVVPTPTFQRLTPGEQRQYITEVLRSSREAARGRVMMQYRHIIKDAYDAKVAKLH